jgi:signal transduction histidine kinase
MGGYTMEELLSLTVSDICPDVSPEQFADNVAALEHGPLPPIETWTRRKDGSLFLVEVSTARVEFGGQIYLFGVARDITERKRAEDVRKHFAQRLLDTLESERQRVARELYDDVEQAIATVDVLLDAIERSPSAVSDAAKPTFAVTRATIRQVTDSVARIVRDYHPPELLGLGLVDTLRSHARQFAERHGLTLRLSTAPIEGLLAPEQELHVYRIVQEALANVARHARAAQVRVRLTRSPRELVLTIADDGVGFELATPGRTGIGLITMRERAALIPATLTIDSAPDAGTTLCLRLPVVSQVATRPPRVRRPPQTAGAVG